MLLIKFQIWFRTLIITVLVILLIPPTSLAQIPSPIHYKFTQTDSNYTFYGSFKIKADPECLLDILFNYKHIKALAVDAKEVVLIDQGKNWNQISFTYQKYIFFKNKSIWHRVLHEEDKRVEFTLLSSYNNRKVMPQILSSSGFYQIHKEGEFYLVEYYQECQLTEHGVTKLYLQRAKKGAIKFMHVFSEYAVSFCEHVH